MNQVFYTIQNPLLHNIITILLISILVTSVTSIRFISHLNAKGLRGNITFDVEEVANASILVIESTIESSLVKTAVKDQDDFNQSHPIMFDWSLHQNTLTQDMLISCSIEDTGATLSDKINSAFTSTRQIILNEINRWTIPLDELLNSTSVESLSSLLWGRSVRLKLSVIHADKAQPSKISNQEGGTNAKLLPSLGSSSIKPSSSSTGLSKPQLSNVAPSAPTVHTKPTFAPRPKSSLAGRPKPTFAPLPQPEALVAEIETTTSSPFVNHNETLTLITNKRIQSIFGKRIICGNVIDTRKIKSVEAVFTTQIAGKISLRGNEDDTTLISLNLYHLKSKLTTRHDWKILASDILDKHRHDDQCRYLQVLFDPDNVEDSSCKANNHKNCKMGDMSGKHGQLQIAGQGKNTRTNLIDLNLPLSALEGSRTLFLVIYEIQASSAKVGSSTSPSKANILSCAQIIPTNSRKLEATINMDGVRGNVKISQRHFTEPAIITYDLFGLEGNTRHQSIRELPVAARSSSDNIKLCNSLGDIYNPFNTPIRSDNHLETVDSFPIGNLSAKHGQLTVIDSEYEDHYMDEFIDLSLQLFGPRTVAGRSILIHKNNGDPWICATLIHSEEPINIAVATFHYPVVGRITFQQLANDPYAETGVLVDVYNPNSDKDSSGHNWLIHLAPAMADFYNWSQRCESSGEIYDPLQVGSGLSVEQYARQCQLSLQSEPYKCRTGDLSIKSNFKLNLPTSHLNRSRFYYTDPFLPLAKANSIIGRSIVIYDENSPKQRGNRLACSTIKSVHPLKAAIRTWNSGPSIPSAVLGSVTFRQESETSQTDIKIDLSGFNGNVEHFAIHNAWTLDDREFPCSNDSLYDIYDPYDNENSLSLPPSAHYGSLATVDRVKVGDMSRKHGTFEGLQVAQKAFQDANLPLFAPRSIIGRSMVLRAAVNDFRWVCGSIELDYDKSESREIIGIASFDEPRSKIAGSVRFTQLEHKDGSLSDTFVQIDLKLQSDGVHELQTSHAHNWAIFVNQVGEDAFIIADDVRCIAAGFKWNPYLAQDSLESYSNSCNPSEQLACAMGDLGMRHGSLTLGPNNRRVISDTNLPLVGNYSIMGRSLIIFDNKKPTQKLACANIFPDIHLKSNVVIKRTPSFTVARFVEQMRTLLGAAEWLIVPELKATKSVANGECVQMTIHFYGRKAHQLQVELNNLVSLGTVRKATRSGVDKISTHFKPCRAGETQLTSSAISISTSSNMLLISLLTLVAFIIG